MFTKTSDVYLANADGTDAHKLFTAPGSFSCPAFSMDGSRIRFTSAAGEQNLFDMGSSHRWDAPSCHLAE